MTIGVRISKKNSLSGVLEKFSGFQIVRRKPLGVWYFRWGLKKYVFDPKSKTDQPCLLPVDPFLSRLPLRIM